MGLLIRRSWSRQSDPTTWDRPVNQASKWLAARSGAFRILSEGGSVTVTNGSVRQFLLSVFVGDGGSVNLGGTSGNNTIRISRSGTTVSVTVQTNGGTSSTKTFTTSAPYWSNVYIKCSASGLLSNQVTITAMIDFNQIQEMVATGAIFGDQFTTNNKVLTCDALSGWAWFAEANPGFFGWGASTTIPHDDIKYREAFINNGTWDIASPGDNWSRPEGLKFVRGWVYQGGGGRGGSGGSGRSGGDGGDGGDGYGPVSSGKAGDGGDGGKGGNGTGGGDGGYGGNGGSPGGSGDSGGTGATGKPGGTGTTANQAMGSKGIGGSGGSGGAGGSAGSGGSGGAGGPGKYIAINVIRESETVSGGQAGTAGTAGTATGMSGTKGANGAGGTNASKNGKNGSPGGNASGGGTNGRNGGDGSHCNFGGANSSDGTAYSNGTTTFGATTFQHNRGMGSTDGGVVLYYQW